MHTSNKTRCRLSTGANLLLSLLVWSIPTSAGNVQDQKLEPNASVTRELAGTAVDTFKISVSEKQYFRVVVEQQGIELIVTLRDRNNAQRAQIFSSSGPVGPLYISEIANSTDYTLQVQKQHAWAKPGSYTVKLEPGRTPRPEDHDRIRAERLLSEGHNLARDPKTYAEAIEKLTEAQKLFKGLDDRNGQVKSLHVAGMTYRALRRFAEARDSLTQALDLAPGLEQNNWRYEPVLRNDLSLVYSDFHDEEKARSLLSSALQIFEAKSDQRGQAQVFNNLGLSLAKTGKGRQAIQLYERALEIRRLENDKVNEFLVLNNLAGAYDALGEFRVALGLYEQAVRFWRDTKNFRLPVGLNNIGLAYEKLGHWQKAIDYYRDSLAIVAQSGPKQLEPITLLNLGDLYSKLNDSSRALESYNKALAIQREVKNHSEEVNLLAHIGTVYTSLNKPAEALKNLNDALQIIETKPNINRRYHTYTLLGLGDVFRLQDKASEALKYFEEARKLAETVADRQQESDAHQKLGETYHASRDSTKAQESYDKALTLRRGLEDRLGEATTLYHIAKLKRDLNQLNEAATASAAALKHFEALRETIASNQLRTSYFETTQQCFELFIDVELQLYKKDSDVRHVEAAFAANEQAHARTLVDILTQASPLIREGINPALLEKKRELFESLSSRANNRQALLNEREVQQRAYDQDHKVEQLVALQKTEGRLADLAVTIPKLIAQTDDLETQIRRESPKYAALTNPPTLNLKDIQTELLDDNTILLEYALGDQRSFAFVVSSTKPIKAVELPKRAEIELVARRLGSALTAANVVKEDPRTSRVNKAHTSYSSAASALSKMIVAPVAPLLDKKRVLVVADGALQLIPFAVLPISSNSKRLAPRLLIEEYELITLPSASVLGVQRRELKDRKPAPNAVAVLANAVFESSDQRIAAPKKPASNNTQVAANASQEMKPPTVPPSPAARSTGFYWLPFSLYEAMAIQKVAPPGKTMLALGFEANRSTMMSSALSQYQIVHLATHGVADPDHPELSEVILSLFDENGAEQNGRLRLYEIYNLNLPAELVVISACDTGVGKQLRGEGLIALTRGFMYAGAKSVVASLWKVGDSATAALMAEFYKEMFTNGREPAAALRAAQLTISKKSRWRDPYFWSGFVIQGDWR